MSEPNVVGQGGQVESAGVAGQSGGQPVVASQTSGAGQPQAVQAPQVDELRKRVEGQLGVKLDGVATDRLYDDAVLSLGLVQRIFSDPGFEDVRRALELKMGGGQAGASGHAGSGGQAGSRTAAGQPAGSGTQTVAFGLEKPPQKPEPWMWQAVRRMENGRYVGASPHTPAAVVDLVNAWADWEAVRRERLVSDPASVLVPELEGPLSERILKAAGEDLAKRVREEVKAQQDAVLAQAFVTSNAYWLYGPDGQLSEDGKRFQAKVKELETDGKLSSAEVLRRAVLEVRGKKSTTQDVQNRIASLIGQKNSGNGGQPQSVGGRLSDRDYLAKALGWDLDEGRVEFQA